MDVKKKVFKMAIAALFGAATVGMLAGCNEDTVAGGQNSGDQVAQPNEELKWTNNPISIYIPGSPGGGSDLTTRYLTQTWNEITGINFQPTNYDSTSASFQALVGEKPDGQTLNLAHTALITQYVTGGTNVHPLEDVTLIGYVGNNGLRALGVPVDAPYDTFEEFLAYIKENPGTIKAGISPNGTTQFLMGLLEQELDVEFAYVEASAETDRLTSLAGGFIDIGSISLANGLEYEKAGKLKVIATVGANGAKIADVAPEAPDNFRTIQEMGYENVYAVTNYYVIGPAGMDEEQVKKMNQSLEGIVKEGSAYQKGMIDMGQVPEWTSLEESKAILEDEFNTLSEVAKALNIYKAE